MDKFQANDLPKSVIFRNVNDLSESVIVERLKLTPAKDGRSVICPECGHGTHGDGVRQSRYKNRLVWHCHGTCGTHWSSNSDFIAAVEGIDVNNKSELAKRLEELFPEEKINTSPLQGNNSNCWKVEQSSERNFALFYERCRRNYSLRKFIDSQAGLWRGFVYETLDDAGCLYNAEYTYSKDKPPAPVIILPYDDELFYWRRVDEVSEGERKGGVPRGTSRRPYFALPIDLNCVNFIVEAELDALSISQEWRTVDGRPFGGVVATGGASVFRATATEFEKRFGKSERKPSFVVLFDNDEAGARHGSTLTTALQNAGFPTVQYFFASRIKGEYIAAHGVKKYQAKVDANDLLRQGKGVLFQRLIDIVDAAGVYLDAQRKEFRRQNK